MKTITIAEIGINYAHGTDKSKFVDNAKKLIDAASLAGFSYVKLQKRNPDVCVPEEQKSKMKKVPWRKEETTYLQYKKDIELSYEDYVEISTYAHNKGLGMFASVWDKDSVDFMKVFHTFYSDNSVKVIMKIPSALITDIELIKYARVNCDILLMSTGMSNEKEIEKAVEAGKPDVLFHTNSSYPSPVEELNLRYILHLKKKYPSIAIGWSGHEYGLTTTFAAVALGATWIERHVTTDRMLWGSDQVASVEPIGQFKLIKGIKDVEKALGIKGPRCVLESELIKRKSLRGE